MEQSVDKLGVIIAPDFISQKLQDPQFVMMYLRSVIPAYLLDAQGKMKEKELRAFLKASGMTIAEFDALLENVIKQLVLSEILGSLSYATSGEIK